MLRDYQQRAIDMLYEWLRAYPGQHPCLVMPTGSGKSHVIAALCKDALQNWPETRILMLTHVKELIQQNAEKMRLHWPGAPMGIYSAGLGRKQMDEPLTFAGIQSIRHKADLLGHIDLVIIDECHLVNHKDSGGYRELINHLVSVNPHLRIIGFSATPYRLGHGLITEKPALFDGLINPVSIEELIFKGYLSTLRSKVTEQKLDTSGVHKRGGDFIESELQAAVDTHDINAGLVQEVIRLAGDRKAWLFFCTGIDHAQHVADALKIQGIPSACVTGQTPKAQRAQILDDFKSGKLRALTNANVLTTGFDYPDIDLIAMARPTLSASLYVQMAGRGMRVKSHTDHCLVLDFAGVVEMHGPITAVITPEKKGGEGEGVAPTKTCKACGEICALSVRECPACKEPFPEPEKNTTNLSLHDDDIMGLESKEMQATEWTWRKHLSKSSGKEMLSCTYYGGMADKPVTEYFPLLHGGYAEEKAHRQLLLIAKSSGVDLSGVTEAMDDSERLDWVVDRMNQGFCPDVLEYRLDGKFFRVITRSWK